MLGTRRAGGHSPFGAIVRRAAWSRLNRTIHEDVLTGSDDIRPDRPVRQLVNLMPNAQLVLIENAGHNLWLTHAARLKGLLRDFLSKAGIVLQTST